MTLHLRSLQKSDIPAIEKILRANAPVFSETEVKTAVAMLEAGVGAPEDPEGHRFLVAEHAGRVEGYALYAAAPLTKGTFDLYWIAADPSAHGKGAGRALLAGVEDACRKLGGRLLVIETSSRTDYARARHFYERAGYTKAAVLTDYYRDGDDKVIYTRRIDRG